MRARSSRAPAPFSRAKRAPVILAARSKSRMPRFSADIPVGLRGKVEAGGFPPGLHHRVVVAGGPQGHGLVGQVGQIEQENPHPGVIIIYRIIKGFQLLIDCRYLQLNVLSLILVAGLKELTCLFRQDIALLTQFFQLGYSHPAFSITAAKLVQGNRLAPVFQGLFHFLLVFSHKLQIQHG